MSNPPIVLHGRIRPDGTVQIDERVNLPPGPIQVTVEASRGTSAGEDTQSVLKQIRARRLARGAAARSKEEIDAEINAMRDEDEQRMREIEAIGRLSQDKKE
jgi:hypothetical protein